VFLCVTQLLVLVSCAVLIALTPAMAQPGSEGAELPPDAPVTPVSQLYGPVPLARIVDGDTLVVESNIGPRTVRLIGIDTPEIGSGEPGGREAQAHLARLLGPGLLIWLELDLGLEDIYGRLLAYVYVPDANGAWEHAGMRVSQVNLAMIEAGWARTLTIAPNVTYADLYRAAARQAEAAERGIWATDFGSTAGAEQDTAGAQPGSAGAENDAVTADGSADDEPPIRLHCGLLNPTTPNDVGEWVSVMLTAPYDTRGYYLFDEGSRSIFRLPAGVQPAGELRISNPGQGVWNNSGDVIYLMKGGAVVDMWEYAGHEARSGVIVCRD
jgi:micrococcal nuclease